MAHVHHETPEERKRSLNLWLIFVVVLVLIAAAALALVLILRDDDEKGGGGAAPPTTTTVAAAPTNPEEFAKALYADWQAGDRTAAATVASPEAVEALFQFAYEPLPTNAGPTDPYSFQNCEGAAGSIICTWSGQDNAQIVMTVRNTTGGLPVLVVNVTRQGG
ncbi:MAG: hypothetical protein MUP67_09340 [Acidimicrobiia bacterium]|nr:hypothetical protein [Acidimicrobiia bacterium]